MRNPRVDRCANCDEVRTMSKDHIVPQSFVGFIHPVANMDLRKKWYEIINSKENIKWDLCRTCNARKSKYLDFKNPQTKTILQKLYEELK